MKKILAFCLMLTLLLTALPSWSVNAEEATDFTGYVAITNAQELAQIQSGSSSDLKKYYLTQDIEVPEGWRPAYAFYNGILDGNGHTVSGISVNGADPADANWPKIGGLFTRVYGTVTIRNLTVRGSITSAPEAGYDGTASNYEVGGLIGTADGVVRLENVRSEVNIVSTIGNSRIGGFIGFAAANGVNNGVPCDLTVVDSVYNGSIQAVGKSVGGFIGDSFASVQLQSCQSDGSMTVGGDESNVGGMVGCVARNGPVTVADSVNRMNITLTAAGNGGGFAGTLVQSLSIRDSINDGTVNGSLTASALGGFVGSFSGVCTEENGVKSYAGGGPLTLTDCLNRGDVKNGLYMGGMLGILRSANAQTVMEGCVNRGTLQTDVSAGYPSVGGILGDTGWVSHDLDLVECVNLGTVSSQNNSGGIAGSLNITDSLVGNDVTLRDCSNYGTVISTANGVGGIFQYSRGACIKLVGCTNYAELSGTQVGGIGLNVNLPVDVSFIDCVNYADLQAVDVGQSQNSVAGILCYVGNASGNSAALRFERCVNFGTLSSSVRGWTRAAGIFGGLCDNANGIRLTFQSCSNFGALVISEFHAAHPGTDTPLFAGIVASVNGGSSDVTMDGCYSTGVVKTADGSRPDTTQMLYDYVHSLCGRALSSGTLSMTDCVSAHLLQADTLVASNGAGFFDSGSTNYSMSTSTSWSDVKNTLNNGLSEAAFTVENGALEPLDRWNAVSASLYTVQVSEPAMSDSSVNIRLVGVVDGLAHQTAGFHLRVSTTRDFSSAPMHTKYFSTVYKSLNTDGDAFAKNVGAPYGTFLMPLVISSVPTTGEFFAEVTPFADTFVGKTVQLHFVNGSLEFFRTVDNNDFFKQDNEISVLSYNLAVANQNDSGKKAATVALIQKYDPDILAVQEASVNWFQYLKSELSAYAAVGFGRDSTGVNCATSTASSNAGEGCYIFYKKNVFSLNETKTYWLSPTPTVKSQYAVETDSYYRIVTWAKLTRKSDGKQLVHCNTHLELSAEARALEIEQILGYMAPYTAQGLPVLISGDFNMQSDEAAFASFANAGFDNSMDAASLKGNIGETFVNSTATIDFVMCNRHLTVEYYSVKHTAANPSDHHPVWVEYSF